MTVVTSTGASNQNILTVFSGTFTISAFSDTSFTASAFGITATITGTGLTYDAQQQGGVLAVAITGGTITGVSQNNGTINQTWTGFNVSGAAASNAIAIHDYTSFNNMFFGGADTFNYTTVAGTSVYLTGYNGDDVFNVGGGIGNGDAVTIDGGSGTDTLNLSGGIATTITGVQQSSNFSVTNVETIRLAGGANYNLIVPNGFAVGGTLLDASALGASNHLVLSSRVLGGGTYVGNLTLIGGAGDDTIAVGSSANVFNGGGGTNTLDFSNLSFGSHVTVNLGNTGQQSLGYGSATGTFSNFQNVIGTGGNDIITGDNGNNVILTDGGDDVINAGGGNDTIVVGNPGAPNVINGGNNTVDGGAGTDTIVLPGARGSTTFSASNGVVTITGTGGIQTVTNVEYAQFTDQTVALFGVTVNTGTVNAARNQTLAASTLFSVTSNSGLPITEYQFLDTTTDNSSGHFVLNGSAQQAGTVIDIAASQLSQLSFVTGTIPDTLQIRAFDGNFWSAPDNGAWSPFTVIVPNTAPVLTTADTSMGHRQTVALSSLFTVSDADGDPITRYQLWDATNDPASGYFLVDGQIKPASTVIDISAAQMATASYVSGVTGDGLQIRAFDGAAWSAADNVRWAPFTVTVPNAAPVLTTADTTVHHNRSVALTDLFSVTDADNDPMVSYQLWDSTNDPDSGYFLVDGVAKPSSTIINVTAAQMANSYYVSGTVGDGLQIRASDGAAWSAADNVRWAPFTVTVPVNHAPVVNTADTTLLHGRSVALTSLFSVTDADSDSMTRYQLWDSTNDPNSGHFVVNGQIQPSSTVIDLTPSQLLLTSFVAGTVGDGIQIRAYDGALWSAADTVRWAPFTVSVPVDNPPVLTTTDMTLVHGQSVALSSLFTVTDAENDTITRYQLWDSTTDPNSGHFVVNGVVKPAATVIDITADQLAQTSFVAGTVGDGIQIRAYDGVAWSAADNARWAPFVVTVPPNLPPVLTTADVTLAHGQTVALSSLFTVSDGDNDPITRYQLWDSTTDPNSGHFVVNNIVQPAATVIDITAAQMAQASFVAGTVGDGIQIRAYDGYGWSAADNVRWSPFVVTVPVNHAPVLTTTDMTLGHGQSVALSSLFSVTDSDGDAMTRYQLWDSTTDPNSGHFVVNNVAQPAATVIDITAAQLAQTSFVAGTVGDGIQIRAYDGAAWSAADNVRWAPFTVTVPVNHAPVLTTSDVTLNHGQSVALSSLFTVTDADGDAMTRYQLWDSTTDPNSGHFMINGQAQPAATVIDITAAQLALTSFVAGTVGDGIQIRAYDGAAWSAADTVRWAPFTVTVPVNHAPVLTTSDVTLGHNQSVALSSLFTVSDADNDPITRYQLWDSTTDSNSGHFVVAGVAQPAATVIDITAAQLAQTSFVTGTVGDGIQIRAFDGAAWSAADNSRWAPFHVAVT